jgi:peptidoglycan/LPS O-acetylase OafA/YrhL
VQRVLGTRPLRWLATYSYGIYVFHFPLVPWLVQLNEAAVFPTARQLGLGSYLGTVAFLTASAVSIVLAVVSYHLFEKHFLKLKRFVPRPSALSGLESRESGRRITVYGAVLVVSRSPHPWREFVSPARDAASAKRQARARGESALHGLP